jgi:hypothetical protein
LEFDGVDEEEIAGKNVLSRYDDVAPNVAIEDI